MSDYLWDKTGEPDEDVERLEELLGSFGHKPRALELPSEAAPQTSFVGGHLRRFRPSLVAAAALLLMALAAGAALVLLRKDGADTNRHSASTNQPVTPSKTESPAPPEEPKPSFMPEKRDERARRSDAEMKKSVPPDFQATSRKRRQASSVARGAHRQELQVAVAQQPPAPTRLEQQAAKEQLVYALRLASAKLNEVRKMTRGEETPRHSLNERDRIR